MTQKIWSPWRHGPGRSPGLPTVWTGPAYNYHATPPKFQSNQLKQFETKMKFDRSLLLKLYKKINKSI